MQQNGTMVTVTQHCSKCTKGCVWRSQPFVHGKCPVGYVLLSFAILMAGASISKILLVFRHMGLSVFSSCTFFSHQRSFVFPTVIHHWESYRTQLINTLKNMKEVVWSGDGRFDSMGHSAKYGAYTMFCSTIMKVVHFELVQVRKNTHHVSHCHYQPVQCTNTSCKNCDPGQTSLLQIPNGQSGLFVLLLRFLWGEFWL